ncbi:MAG: hypothetical protein HY848_19405 [Betaproteobacteria bacterium]|nr:hypothetical protein [Betaproteobacteria bacterium]
MLDEHTLYSIIDEHGDKSTITLDKMIADALQESLPDVHVWIQAQYNRVAARKPELGRIQKGDLVRLLAQREAEKHPAFHRMIEELLGPPGLLK